MPNLTTSSDIDAFMQAADNAAARTSLGLGTAATSAAADFATAAQGTLADSAVQPGDLGGAAALNVGTTAGTVAAGDHTHGDATTLVAGFMAATDKSKLDGIEAGADVTDATNVAAAGAVMESDYDANTILAATSDNTPVALTVGEATMVGRQTGGAIAAIARVSAGEITAGTETALRAFSPKDVADMAGAHGGGGGGLTNITETLHTASPNNTVNAEQLEVTGGTTNTDLVLTPKGTGALIIGPNPNDATTGGNKRGTNTVDLQTRRSAANQVAAGNMGLLGPGEYLRVEGGNNNSILNGSGNTITNAGTTFAIIGTGDRNNIATNAGPFNAIINGQLNSITGLYNDFNFLGSGAQCSIAARWASLTTGYYSAVTANFGDARGGQAKADRYGMRAFASGSFNFPTQGEAQGCEFLLRNKTTTNAAVELFLDGSSARLTIPSGKVLSALIQITGIKSDGSAVAHYVRQFALKNAAGTTSQVYAAVTVGTDNAAGTSIAISADDTNDSLKIEATGVTSETWRWVARVDAVEIAYGT